MLANYSELGKAVAEKSEQMTISVGVAHDRELLESLAHVSRSVGIKSILYGNAAEIERILGEIASPCDCRIVDEPDDAKALFLSVRSVHDGEAHVLMKGQSNTSDFMRAVLDKNDGLRSGSILSHLASFEIAGFDRMIFVTDGGITIAPNLDEKKKILANSLSALKNLGYDCPKVAVLTANEQVNPKAQATVDAAEIANAWKSGEFDENCIVEGPMALDVALSREAAEHKHIKSEIAGSTDLFLVSNIEVGNVFGKCMANIAGAKMAGVVLGASAPIVLTSRAESATSKYNSILLACGCAQ